MTVASSSGGALAHGEIRRDDHRERPPGRHADPRTRRGGRARGAVGVGGATGALTRPLAAAAATPTPAVVGVGRRAGSVGGRRGGEEDGACSGSGRASRGTRLLFGEEQVASPGEVRQRGGEGNDVGDSTEIVIQAAESVEDEIAVAHGMSDIAESIGRDLEALGVLGDGGRALRHGVEFLTEVDGPGVAVGREVLGDAGPELTSSLIGLDGDIQDVLGDGGEEPCPDSAVRLQPGRIVEA